MTTQFIERALVARELGLAPHYPFLHAAVTEMLASQTLEFGAGGSTRVFLDALATASGLRGGAGQPASWAHVSFSTESRADVAARYGLGFAPHYGWTHVEGDSMDARGWSGELLDIVLHDGSHAADVVAEDVAWVWPKLRRYGLLLVHDTLHSYTGAEVRTGLRRGLAAACADFTATTLPFGFGLTVVRREDGTGFRPPRQVKDAGTHETSGEVVLPASAEVLPTRRLVDAFHRTLEGREAEIFQRLMAAEPESLRSVADRWGISRSRVQQIAARLDSRFAAFVRVQALEEVR